MTGLIAIDESGDLGSAGTKYFSIAAIVMLRPRDLKKAADFIPNDRIEHKWNNSLPGIRKELLHIMSDLRFNIVYTVVDKNNPPDNRPIYGNALYGNILRQVISDAMDIVLCKDVNVLLDSCRFITIDHLKEIVYEEAVKHNVNVKMVNKVQSEQNKCIQLVDFIAGASRAMYENNDNTIEILRDKISIARRR